MLKRSWAGEVRNVSVLVAIAVNSEGYREIIGVAEGAKEDEAGWSSFLIHLKARGLRGVKLFISDKCMGLVESVAEFFPEARRQRCVVHFYRNVFTVVPKGRVREVAAMLKAIHAQENREQALAKATYVENVLREMKLPKAADIFRQGIEETLEYMYFPDGNSALMLVAARLRHIAGTQWGTSRYLNTELLRDHLTKEAAS